VKLHKHKPGAWHGIEQAVLTEAANLLLPSSNPKEGRKTREGVIYFERDQSKGFLNFVWKSVLSGIKSSAGFNSKIQRQIRKEEKKK
jgi:hypothetical protein